MTRQSTAEQWQRSQEAYRRAQEALEGVERNLRLQYGDIFWARAGDRKRLDALRARRDRIANQMIGFLIKYSPRGEGWRYGVPLHWICAELTFEDALTSEALSVVPPLAYGQTVERRAAFCAPITREVTA